MIAKAFIDLVSNWATVQTLIQDIVLLMAFMFCYSLARPYIATLSDARQSVVRGVLFGLFAVLVPPLAIAPGLFMDARGIVIAIAGAFRGWKTAAIATAIIIPYRILIGGVGYPGFTAAILATAMLGVWFNRRIRSHGKPYSTYNLLLLGLGSAFCRLVVSIILPSNLIATFLDQTLIAVVMLYPLGTLLAGMLLTHADRTAALQDSQRIGNKVFRMTLNAALVTDKHGIISTVNPAAVRVLGAGTPEDLIGRSINDFVTSERWLGFFAQMQHAEAATDDGQSFESTVDAADGTTIPVNLSIVALRDNRQRVDGYIVVMNDLTEQKHAEAMIDQERTLLRTLIDNVPDVVYVKDAKSRFVLANKAVARAQGVESVDDLIGKTDFDFYPRDLAEQFYADERALFQSGEALVNREEPQRIVDGKPVGWVLTTKLPLTDARGNILGLVGVGRNITDKKKADEAELHAKLEREKIAMIHRFLGDASHDLRTPLSVMGTSLYLLGRSATPEQQRHIDILEMQTAHIQRLIDDMMVLTRLDLADSEFQFDAYDLNHLAQEAVTSERAVMEGRGHTVVFEPSSTPLDVMVDRTEFHRALSKLLVNAASYTPKGGTITVSTRAARDEMIVEIRDTGLGIKSDDLPHIFERFFRADQARSTETGGSGLGLSIVRKIVEAHHGRVEVDSVVGRGSTFYIALPAAQHTNRTHSEGMMLLGI